MHKILLIGSLQPWRATTVPSIEAAGYVVEQADTGTLGFKLAKAQNPNLIICAWELPDTNGHQVLKQIRNDLQLVVTPVILISSLYHHSHLRQTMELGADALLINTAIAKAKDPVKMGRAMGLAAEAGRLAYLSGRIPIKAYASASSPLTGTIVS